MSEKISYKLSMHPKIQISFRQIEFGTPEFDEAIELRTEILRRPLGISFQCEDISEEYQQFHLAGFDISGKLISILVFKEVGLGRIKMRQVAVSFKMQRKGIGNALVLVAEKWAIQNGFDTIELSAREHAVVFYEKLDYEVLGEVYIEVGIPHKAMQKKLSNGFK